ncbi:GNAT family N-acetyltransferase [Piscinibacter sp. Jin2]|uniref:GNAT family N-acetyltransferase n=1 Tax=Aquariibacter lacus TaxID=2801332 RepID=A0A9X0XDQ9_9BURK|nr:GNAT family protein [Piscinibacter lacus]MBL0719969.1 GNAT family N-acetyltransferase [Piscinibacter lacus]
MQSAPFAATLGQEPTTRGTVRRLGPADLSAYKTLRDQALRLHPDAFTADAESESRRDPESYLGRLGLCDPLGGTALFGAFVGSPAGGEQLVGSVGLERETRGKLRHTANVIGLIVLPGHNGLGLGRQLVERVLDEARRAPGLEMLTISISAHSERVLRLYERAGFRRYGLLPRALRLVKPSGVQYVDKVQMLLML